MKVVKLSALYLLEVESTPRAIVRPGIEPATFRLVAPCINQLRYRAPPYDDYIDVNLDVVDD